MQYIVFHAHFSTNTKELIEFSAIKFDEFHKNLGYFDSIVKPKGIIEERTTKITGLRESSFESAVTLVEFVEKFKQWINATKTTFLTWNNAIIVEFQKTINFVDPQFLTDDKWVSLDYTLMKMMKSSNPPSLRSALDYYGIEFVGSKGISQYECENIANIFTHLKLQPTDFYAIPKSKSNKPQKTTIRRTKIRSAISNLLFRNLDVNWESVKKSKVIQNYMKDESESENIETILFEKYKQVVSSEWYQNTLNKMKNRQE